MATILRRISNSVMVNEAKYFKDTNLLNLELTLDSDEKKISKIDSIMKKFNIVRTFINIQQNKKYNNSTKPIKIEMSIQNISPMLRSNLEIELSRVDVKTVYTQPIQVPWFPRRFQDINLLGKTLLEYEEQFNNDHPQFTDKIYRKRRDQIASIANTYNIQDQIPIVNYTHDQHQLWRGIIKRLRLLHKNVFCSRYERQISQLNRLFKIQDKIPQLCQLSQYLHDQTGFRIKPVQGIVSQRQFLNALAFKVFLSTQYLRHKVTPDYTPEPDIVHQVIGHVPMFADPQIAKLSQQIGLYSLGASDEEIKKLGSVYWFTLQFGVCKQNGTKKAYGAGIASCVKQILNFAHGKAEFKTFEPKIDCLRTQFPVQDVQPLYCVTQCFQKTLQQIKQYGNTVQKPIKTTYDATNKSINYNRSIETFNFQQKNPYFQ